MNAPAAVGRRDVLKSAVAGVAVTVLGPTLLLMEGRREATAAAPAGRRWGLLIDVSRCRGDCSRCVDACSAEHGWQVTDHGAQEPQWIRLVTVTDPASGRTVQMPLMCQHCANAPCANVCPTGATFRRADGIVLVDRHICIGCRYCVMACPIGVRFFEGEPLTNQRPHTPRGMGTAEGCNLCVHRVDNGRLPACVEACQAAGGAMTFGDLDDADSPIRKALATSPATRLRSDLVLAQGVQYQGL